MNKLQFRVLYRQFLFRMVDLEVLSAQAMGDASKLYGQFATLLIAGSIAFAVPALGGFRHMQRDARFLFDWSFEHFLIATTMLTVGLFAVLSWDSTFPDRRDVLVLAPLPVRAKTIFSAKVAAVASALALTVLFLHSAAGLLWPLVLSRDSAPQSAPVLSYLPAMAPLDVAAMPSAMARDLAPAMLTGGALAPENGTGVTIGVLKNGRRRVFSFGTARPDSLFEIASITKTFTATILARMLVDGKLQLNERVRNFLPPSTVRPSDGDEVTLIDLATHHSGMPGMPFNLQPADPRNPLVDYGVPHLYRFLARWGLRKPREAGFSYSNVGFAVLGVALSNRAEMPYPELLKTDVTGPLGLRDTVIALSPAQAARLIQGHNTAYREVPAWDMDVMTAAGGIRSDADDMLTYLDAHLHPEKFDAANPRFAAALRETHVIRGTPARGAGIGLAWMYNSASELYYHSGATAGYTSEASFNPKTNNAVIVLVNSGPGQDEFATLLGAHVRQRLMGQPATTFARVVIPAGGGLFGALRSFVAYWITMLAAGVFIFCCVLGLQGVAAQLLPRRLFLRVSSLLQLTAFCVLVCVYVLQPIFPDMSAIVAAENRWPLSWSPSYWFVGLFQALNGSPALAPLAHRAWVGLLTVLSVTAAAYALSYWRTLRQIVEEPDIVPGTRRANWLPRFGTLLDTLVGQFAARTLMRSRLHRMILAFYLGVGFAITVFVSQSPPAPRDLLAAGASDPWRQVNIAMLFASIAVLALWLAGMRVVFGMPLDLRANWVFRVAPMAGGPALLKARRRAMFAIGLAPVLAASTGVFLWLWPWRQAAGHLLVLALLGAVLAEMGLQGVQKIPFACSYLPGKSNVHITFWFSMLVVFQFVIQACKFEQDALQDPFLYIPLVAGLALAAAAARWWTQANAKVDEGEVLFEDPGVPAVQVLGLSGG
jgi:CubicO group peptidase (beta-lactamase class C family)